MVNSMHTRTGNSVDCENLFYRVPQLNAEEGEIFRIRILNLILNNYRSEESKR